MSFLTAYIAVSFLGAAIILVNGFFIFWKGSKNRTTILWGAFSIAIASWSVAQALEVSAAFYETGKEGLLPVTHCLEAMGDASHYYYVRIF